MKDILSSDDELVALSKRAPVKKTKTQASKRK